MAKYIEVINDSNVVSVDDSQARLSLMRSVNLSNVGYDQSGSYEWPSGYLNRAPQYCATSFYRFPIQLGSNEKMFSLRALADNPHTGFTRLASNNATSYLYAYRNRNNTIDFSNYVLDFYGYDNSATGTVGLQVFDSNSNLIFNSNKYYFDIKGSYNIQHEDYFARIFVRDGVPKNINIGGYQRSNSAVVINNGSYNLCKFSDYYDLPPYDMVFSIVFGSTIYLEPRIAFWVNAWSTYTNPSNHIAYPNFSRVSSGVILDTTNIS